jgi:glutamate racemase
MSSKTGKIGIFDSGVGGITVLEELRRRFPSLNFIYLGDTAHVPYGPKSPKQIQMLSVQCAEILKKKSPSALIVACNTASSWALSDIEQAMAPIPVMGVVQPGVQAALAAWKSLQKPEAPILVLATRATVQSHAYKIALTLALAQKHDPHILEQACPLLVPMIEEGWTDHSILHQMVAEYVQIYHQQYPKGVALLGCTHYPWIHAAFEKALPNWKVVNSASAIAESLIQNKLFLPPPLTVQKSMPGTVEWIFTDEEAVPNFVKTISILNK